MCERKLEDHSQMRWNMPIIPATGEAEVIRSQSKASPGNSRRTYLKNKLKARTSGVVQVVKHLPSKHKALSSSHDTNPSTKKEERKKGKEKNPR
jgi:hypothetical protein